MLKAGTWQLVFGGLKKMPSEEALVQPIGGQLVQHGRTIPSGGSSVSHSSLVMK